MAYAKTSQRAEERELREQMRGLRLSRRQIAAEFGRRHGLRPRAAWRHAYGWSLKEAAERISGYAAQRGLDPSGATVAMTAPHLSEYENWPGHGTRPTGRRPTPYLLSLLADVYQCAIHDLLDLADYEHMPPADRLIIDRAGPADPSRDQEAALREGRRRPWHAAESRTARRESDPDAAFSRAMQVTWPEVGLSPALPGCGADWQLRFPGGRTLNTGGFAVAQVHPLKTAGDGRAFLPVVGGPRFDQFTGAPYRGMLIGVDEKDAGGTGQAPARLFGADLREAHRKIARSPGVPSAVAVPRAYELDDLTYGIAWALVSLDDALLADDRALDQWARDLRTHERLAHSAVGPQAAADLTSAARMWLGSNFCARYIVRNLAPAPGVPVFWTREQSGEEACAWLLFRHKHDYLRRISGQFGGASGSMTRGFCVPEDVVRTSPRWERILLFLSVALMESLGIRIRICAEPEYADVEGFVLVPGQRAVIATWVRADSIWHVGTVARSPALRTFGEVTGHVTAHSVSEAATPGRRLIALADYLGLDWAWLWRRCAELGEQGCAGLVAPRSRLLSTGAADTALRYVGLMGRDVGQS